jgi:hypothetical protein
MNNVVVTVRTAIGSDRPFSLFVVPTLRLADWHYRTVSSIDVVFTGKLISKK